MKRERDELKDLVGQRLKTLREKASPTPENSQRTGKQTLKILLADSPTPKLAEIEKAEPKIVLYLRDGLNPAKSNFTKYPNDMHNLLSEKLSPYESVAYVWIWRISWGFGRNYCRFGQRDLLNNTSITSLRTAQRVIKGLREGKFIIAALDETGVREATNKGSLYRVCTPKEIIEGMTEEGVSLKDVPFDGIPCVAISSEAIATQGIASETIDLKGDSTVVREAIALEAIVRKNHENHSDNNNPDGYRQRGYSPTGDPLKDKESIKDTLSQEEIISNFYNCIGQKGVTNKKRESAKNCIEELLSEGYSLEEIQFAAEWTVKNTEKKLYDFSIIEHTISQTMSEKEEIEKREANRLEKEKLAQEEKEESERLEKEYALMESHKAQMSQKDRDELRRQAFEEIKNTNGIKAEFITDILINAKENEILKRKLNNSQLKFG